MKDKIKEILECFSSPDINFSEMLFNRDERLLDYITNLQEENHRLKELCDKYEEEHSTTFNLWKTNIIENVPALSDMQEQLEDYKTRNEKAIEYIKNNVEKDDNGCGVWWYGFGYYQEAKDELLNILQGGDK